MSKVIELLNEAKEAKGVTSDYALAKALELPNQRICDYYKGRRVPDAFACLQISKAIGKSWEEVTALVEAEAEKDEKRREVWRSHLKSLGGIAAGYAAVIFFVVTMIVTPTTAEASTGLEQSKYDFVLCKIQI